MRSWTMWLLGAWSALVLVTGFGAAVDVQRQAARLPATDATSTPPPSAPAIRPLAELGSPPAAAPGDPTPAPPVAVEAPGVVVRASLVPVGKTPDGALAVPDFGTAGWYRHSVVPGAPGAAVLAGHVDSLSGPDVFYDLGRLEPGNEVLVHHADGTSSRFIVHHREVTDKEALPVQRIFDDPAGAELRLITCGGAFDRRTGSYESNVIVYAHLAGDGDAAAGDRRGHVDPA